MAKLKPAKGKKSTPKIAANPQAAGCIIMLVVLFVLVMLSVYYTVASK
jgi:hypothetical protein